MKRTRPRLGEPRRYTFKLSPTAPQSVELFRQASMMARLWNAWLLAQEMRWDRHESPKGVVHSEQGKFHKGRWRSAEKKLWSYNDLAGGKNCPVSITALRQADPDWAALSSASAYRVARALTEAFSAFFRRMKELSDPAVYNVRAAEFRARKGRNPTRYELAGYPKYRSTYWANWLPYSFSSGCKLLADGKERVRPSGRKSCTRWQLRLKGIEGTILTRGEFPSEPLDWSDADLRFKDETWWLSVGVERATAREGEGKPVTIDFNLTETFASTEGTDVPLPDFAPVLRRQNDVDALKSRRDRLWPRCPGKRPNRKYRDLSVRIRRRQAEISRQRREMLHEWTTRIIAKASGIRIIAPEVSHATRTAKGHEGSWGGAVDTVAQKNRTVLSQSPAAAIAMLEYKCAEAGLECVVTRQAKANIEIFNTLSESVKTTRQARREIGKVKGNV